VAKERQVAPRRVSGRWALTPGAPNRSAEMTRPERCPRSVHAATPKLPIERAASLIQHWERRLEFCRLHVELRLRPGTETCAKWTAFLRKFEAKLSALRMRRDLLVELEEAARLDTLPIDACRLDETVTPNVAERFAALFAKSERRLTSASETNAS
jgi:hypothetical protein